MVTVRSAKELTENLPKVMDSLRAGQLLVLPTDTVYGIGADPFAEAAVDRLLGAKGRGPQMPPPILADSPETALALADWTRMDARVETLAQAFWPGPLTLIVPTSRQFGWDVGLHGRTIAVRVPAHELTLQLLRGTGPLAVTSANLTGRPSATTVSEAESAFGEAVHFYLDGGPSQVGEASTIVDCSGAQVRMIRDGALQWEQIEQVLGSNGPRFAEDVHG